MSRVSVVVPSLRGGARLVALVRRLRAEGAELRIADNGMPAADAAELAALGATVTACTPDEFPEVLAAVL